MNDVFDAAPSPARRRLSHLCKRPSATGAALAALLLALRAAPAATDDSRPPTIAVVIQASDPTGNPVGTLLPDDVDVRQDGVRQSITRLERREPAGVYELYYVPSSGTPGPMTIQPARKGLLIRGPGASGDLRPRIIPNPSALESELLALADGPGPLDVLPCEVAVLRYGTSPRGTQYAAAVEVDSGALAQAEGSTGHPKLQIVARLRRDDGSYERLISYERPMDAQARFQRLVWTSLYDLREGAHTLEVVVRDAATLRAKVTKHGFLVAAPSRGLGMSSVVFLQHVPTELAQALRADDPLVHNGAPLLPALRLTLPFEAKAAARFFVLLYPDAGNPAPVALELQVFREETLVGRVPIALPAAEEGRISYVGQVPTRTFRVSPYVLRFVARQGETSVTEDASLVISADLAPVDLRVKD